MVPLFYPLVSPSTFLYPFALSIRDESRFAKLYHKHVQQNRFLFSLRPIINRRISLPWDNAEAYNKTGTETRIIAK